MQDSSERHQRLAEMEKRFLFPSGPQHHEIEEAAFFKAAHRGFKPGHELDDWLEAEREYNCRIR